MIVAEYIDSVMEGMYEYEEKLVLPSTLEYLDGGAFSLVYKYNGTNLYEEFNDPVIIVTSESFKGQSLDFLGLKNKRLYYEDLVKIEDERSNMVPFLKKSGLYCFITERLKSIGFNDNNSQTFGLSECLTKYREFEKEYGSKIDSLLSWENNLFLNYVKEEVPESSKTTITIAKRIDKAISNLSEKIRESEVFKHNYGCVRIDIHYNQFLLNEVNELVLVDFFCLKD